MTSITKHLNLAPLSLDYPRARFQAVASMQIVLSGSEDILGDITDLSLTQSFLNSILVQRGRGMKLEICLSLDDAPVAELIRQDLEYAVLHAKIWSQLGLQASLPSGDEQPIQPRCCTSLTIGLKYDSEGVKSPESNIYSFCHRIPPPDVKAPNSVDTVSLDNIRLSLRMAKVEASVPKVRTRTKKRRRTDLGTSQAPKTDLSSTLLDGSLRQIDILTAFIDAGLRLNIQDRALRCRGLADGLEISHSSPSTPLSMVAPLLWSPGYKEAVATRASLLPTIAHALLHSAENARSSGLQVKLRRLLSFGNNDRDGENDNEISFLSDRALPNTHRIEAMAGCLWGVIQKQLRVSKAATRLHPVSTKREFSSSELVEDDLFSSQDTSDTDDRDLFEDDEDDFLSDRDNSTAPETLHFSQRSVSPLPLPMSPRDCLWSEVDTLLFEDQKIQSSEKDFSLFDAHIAGDASAIPQMHGEESGDDDDDLLLDLLLDENMFAD